ncbi:MAG: hypothetical protein LW629_05240 [Burkholderiales bacterium]|jgi:hypothetical protein|nr:hypothetical protein [Burkholderiales bacterium]
MSEEKEQGAPVNTKPTAAKKKATKKTAVAANADLLAPVTDNGTAAAIKIFQWATPATPKPQRDASFTPLLLKEQNDPLLWLKACAFLSKSQQLEGVGHWGLLAPGFTQKMALSGADLMQQIQENPGFDVYIANPHLEVEALYQNLWVQGEISHPGLLGVTSKTFKALGLDISTVGLTMPCQFTVTSNAVVGNQRFWKSYISFLNTLLTRCAELPAEHQKLLFQQSADPKGLHQGRPFISFIIERLLSDFLWVNQKKLKVFKLSSPSLEKNLSEYVNDLRVLKQAALDQKSQALLRAWASYRTLFLTQVKGKDWVVKNAKALGVVLK